MPPITRIEPLKPLSRDHHHGLLLCWKIRTGFQKNIDVTRIASYADWFYKHYLIAHFAIEEKYVFPVLGDKNELVNRALKEHRDLRKLFEEFDDQERNLRLIEQTLDAHIRFEERILFNQIQEVASPEQLKEIFLHHSEQVEPDAIDAWSDEFWK